MDPLDTAALDTAALDTATLDTATLDTAYERLLATGPEFGGFLSNHAPMVVEVLAHHGLTGEIHPWLDRYERRLERRPPGGGRITDWQAALGDGSRIGDWLDHLDGEVRDAPWRDVLARWWPRLAPGIAGGAAHGVIRVGHAVRALRAHDTEVRRSELGAALGYWAASYRLVPTRRPAGSLGAAAALIGVPRVPQQNGGSSHRLGQLADTTGWHEALAALHPAATSDAQLARTADVVEAAAHRYLTHGHGDGVMLVHAVTAPAAVLRVMPELPREHWESASDLAWVVAAAIDAAYAPEAPWPGVPGSITSSGLLGEAVAHGDEHVIKLADAVVGAHDRSGDPLVLAAGARALDLIQPSHEGVALR